MMVVIPDENDVDADRDVVSSELWMDTCIGLMLCGFDTLTLV